jgi:di/tricarboxylate transporter
MLGGTLTLLGTATNILASDLAAGLTDHGEIGMFEFTPVGILVFLVGASYLLLVAPRLIPARITPGGTLTERFAVHQYLNRLRVRESSPLVGEHLDSLLDTPGYDIRVVQLRRVDPEDPDADPLVFVPGRDDTVILPDDRLTVRANLQTVNQWATDLDLSQRAREDVVADDLHRPDAERRLVTAVLPEGSAFIGETPREARFREWHHTTVLAIRRGAELLRDDVDDTPLQQGDAILVQAEEDAIEFLQNEGDIVITNAHGWEPRTRKPQEPPPLSPKTGTAVGIVGAVVFAAVLGTPIVIAALAGVVLTIATGCLSPGDAYDAVSWNVIFLLAGVIPLGSAMQATGGAQYLGDLVLVSAQFLPLIAVLGLFYLLTGALANIITPVASVVLLIPIAVDTATRLGSDPFSFLLAVMFAASTAFMTPVGYQTNLMVYGPGGYTFGDYVRVGAPLQLILAVVTTAAIAAYWGI